MATMTTSKTKNKLITEYASYFCAKHSGPGFSDDCPTCNDSFGILRDFYNEALYSAAQELRYKQNNCAGECSVDLEGMTEDYD